MMPGIVHIVGTGTIGEPLIGLMADNREAFGIDQVTFHKRTPLLRERGKVNDLVRRGARLSVDQDRWEGFQELGHEPEFEAGEAIERATVVVDCTPAGNQNKEKYYQHALGVRGFLAQGSEFGFGKMYARGINDQALDPDEDRFLHIVSCNTHNIAVLLKTLGFDPDGTNHITEGSFLCIRRANDISQSGGFIPSPEVGTHSKGRFGTHHARDAHHLFRTVGQELNLFSSAIKVNSQYMHALHFEIVLDREITVEEAQDRLVENPRVAVTYKRSAGEIFSFGRDHGYYGRILSQTVVPVETLAVRDGHRIVGFCFTPQDGNPMLSTVAATLWYLHPDGFDDRLKVLEPYVFQEV
ncbi:MAG: hypothetical protein F4Y75_06450 [Acidimicrobiia bacterium]|nr:hypothetical protein [Acidimicrobiia bacterium]